MYHVHISLLLPGILYTMCIFMFVYVSEYLCSFSSNKPAHSEKITIPFHDADVIFLQLKKSLTPGLLQNFPKIIFA